MLFELSAGEVARRMKDEPGHVVLLDVREDCEREFARIEPSIHIPMSELPGRAEEIPKDKEVIVYCHGGLRSLLVAGFLAGHGFKSVANLTGGIDAWSVQVDPQVPRYD